MNHSHDSNQRVKQDLMRQLEADHCIGAPDASIILLEYGDYECESCVSAYPLTMHLIQSFGNRMKLIFRHYPLNQVHPHAEMAAEAAEAAGAQGRFWEMHDLLFRNSSHLKMTSLLDYAEQLELDMTRFKAEMQARIYLQRIQEHRQSGEVLELRSTPAFFLNERFVDVSFGLDHLEDAVNMAVEDIERQT